MKAELITVGTEILMGQILNTNAQYISQRLAELGVDMYVQTTVGDNHDRLYKAIADGLSRADIVIMTGGLGPTADDLSKETAADVLGKELVVIPECLGTLEARFAAMGKTMTPNNVKQAMFPQDAIILLNPNGTAPGCIMERGEKAIALLPGPPRELIPMFRDHLMPYLERRSGHKLFSSILRIFGRGESDVEYALRELMQNQTNPTIAPYALTGETTLRVTARCNDEAEAKRMMEPVMDKIRSILGDVIYSASNQPLHEVCGELLLRRGETVATAESCTGGMLSSRFVSVPGSSKWFTEGAITYANSAKINRLGVLPATLETYGAVSEQTAREMAEGIRRTSGSDYGMATTGVAGPDGGTLQKPVGLVYVAVADGTGTEVRELRLTGDRERIRNAACLNVLDMLRRKLL